MSPIFEDVVILGLQGVEHLWLIVWLPRPYGMIVAALDHCGSVDLDVTKLSDYAGNATFALGPFLLGCQAVVHGQPAYAWCAEGYG